MAQQLEPAFASRRARPNLAPQALVFVVAIGAAGLFPYLDRLANPSSDQPGLISYLGVGLSVLALTGVLLYAGLVGRLPRTMIFTGAVLGYSALLLLVKFVLAPMAVYGQAERSGLAFLGTTNGGLGYIVFPVLTAITAMLYSVAFWILAMVFRSRLRRRLGIPLRMERRFATLMIAVFTLGLVGGATGFGLLGFLEYGLALVLTGGIAVLIAIALLGALILCSAAFQEAEAQTLMLRDVTLFTGFAWVGLAFIAAYHVIWLVFILVVVTLWPTKSVK